MIDRRIIAAVSGVALGLVASSAASAASYASQITETGGDVTFRLNEAADEVIIIRDGVPEVLGAKPLGPVTFARNGAANYQIVVNKSTTAVTGFTNATAFQVGAP